MVILFFCMAFINTTVDSLKDTIVVTAAGSGPNVIPFLTVYGTLPAALLFLFLFSAASQWFDREQLFNGVVTVFVAFFTVFAWVLYPSHEHVHWYGVGESLRQALPAGLSGLVSMVQNWTFTLFYVAAELWGDIGLSLLFWGLANDITTHEEAPIIYPLFGVGANVAQVIAGRFLNSLGGVGSGAASFAVQLKAILTTVAAMGVVVLIVHFYICRVSTSQLESGGGSPRELPSPARKKAISSKKKKLARKPSLSQAVRFLVNSPQIRCLAIMALAQGICTNLMDVAWKTHLRMLCPTPSEYASFMGNVASMTGVVTGLLMVASPILFKKIGWRGVAGATPWMLMVGGVPFFAAAVVYNIIGLQPLVSAAFLQVMVVVGALLYVVCRSAKFSLFKPAEEMVYIGLDEESRTKGKAAIDVVGAQTGKAMSSGLQQVLLLIGRGHLGVMLPFMAAAFVAFVLQWRNAVNNLAKHYMEPDIPEERDWLGMTIDEELVGDESDKMDQFGAYARSDGTDGPDNLPGRRLPSTAS
uniref:ADP,ATP carrier protein n=1 Tax=Tetraselmis sp. GSL018 TaxID=582737 RepID=A0A061RUF3_9CHLO